MNNEQICRCCLGTSDQMYSVSCKIPHENEMIDLLKLFKTFKGIEDLINTTFASYVCDSCLAILESSFKFHKKCLESQKYWNQMQAQLTKKPRKLLPKPANFKSEIKESIIEKKQTSITKRRIYSCKKCGIKFKEKSSLALHSVEHSQDNICHFCQNIFFNNELLKKHVEDHHQSARYKCSMCIKTFATQSQLSSHVEESHGVQKISYFCSMCPYSNEYYDEIELQNHVHINHSNAESAPATVIDVIDSTVDELNMNEEFLDEFFLHDEQDSLEFLEGWDESEFSLPLNYDLKIAETTLKENSNPEPIFEKVFNCPRCNNPFQRNQDLLLHLAREHNEATLACSNCSERFSNEDDLENHSIQHIEDRDKQNVDLNTKESNIVLRTIGSQKYFECKNCAQSFVKKLNFVKHSCKHGPQIQNIVKCSLCPEQFSSFQQMYLHRRVHKVSQTIKCTECDKDFKSASGFRYHMRIHKNATPFPCVYCDKKFSSNATVKSHMRNMHSDYRPYSCFFCDRKFAFADHLKKHVLSTHLKARNYLCSTCGKGFSQLSHLKQHSLIHSEEKKYKCDNCNKTFDKKSDLRKHTKDDHVIQDVT